MKAVITGASSGIGAATALKLSRTVDHLVLVARREERLSQVRSEILKQNPKTKVELCILDVQDRKAIESQAQSTDQFQSVDLLLNNAGLALGNASFQAAALEDWETMIRTNVNGLLYMTRAILPSMLGRKSGHIINIGSVAGRWVYPGGNVYNATKFAVRALSEGLRLDVSGSNIRVTNIEPGMVETEFSLVRFNQDDKKAKQVYAGMNPLTAEDIAETIEWCFQRPAHVNIQELVIYPTDQASVNLVHRR